ncbi:MAG: TlpA family protein disulfide reductase [Alphaproteobacteria bacterium]|nr:TlpA family protein disulfide reductase [Alphaproteobacteria bacterium]
MSRSHLPTRRSVVAAGTAALAATSVPAAAFSASRPAPMWEITDWLNGDGGNVDTLKGKVVIIDFFQLWCPGCNRFSGPLMQHWQEKLVNEIEGGRLQMVKIHTVFEGHDYQNATKLKSYVAEKKITMPVGIDRHEPGQRVPITMRRYRTSGTPEMVIIGPDGMIVFQKFGGFDPEPVESMFVNLLQKVAT